MPLEIIIDTKKKNGLRSNYLQTLQGMDSLSQYIASSPDMARPLSLIEGLKFARQAYYDGDSSSYALPNQFDAAVIAPLLKFKTDSNTKGNKTNIAQLLKTFVDSNQQEIRMSVNVADIGSKRLPGVLHDIEKRSAQLFDSTKYNVELTGGSVTFIEQSRFIINGLRSSIMWAFVLIAICMLYLFRSIKILLCSLIPNTIPLIITAGVMGWKGVALKPSTVLIFSIALGIATRHGHHDCQIASVLEGIAHSLVKERCLQSAAPQLWNRRRAAKKGDFVIYRQHASSAGFTVNLSQKAWTILAC